MSKHDGAASLVRSDALLACPWCGELPDIHKHFRDPLWQLLHRCKIMGALHIDWTDNPTKLAKRWNHRHANTGLHRTEPAAGSGTVRGLVRPSEVSE